MAGEALFEPTIADHVVAQRLWLAYYWKRRSMRWVLALMLLLLIGAVAIATIEVTKGQSPSDAIGSVVWPIVAPLLFAATQGLAWWIIPRSVRKMSRQQPSLLSPTTWRWDDDGMTASSAAGDSIVRWGELHRRLIGKRSIVVMPQERMLLILPKRALTHAQADDLVRTLTAFARPSATT